MNNYLGEVLPLLGDICAVKLYLSLVDVPNPYFGDVVLVDSFITPQPGLFI